MLLSIHVNALAAFDKEAQSLVAQVVKDSSPPPASLIGAYTPDFHTHNVSAADIIGDIIMSKVDVDNVKLCQFVAVNGEQFGLEGIGYKNLRLLSEKIYQRAEVNPYVSLSVIEDCVFQWVMAYYSGKTSLAMTQYCLPILSMKIAKLSVWVPVFGIASEFVFNIGRTTIRTMQKQFFDKLETIFASQDNVKEADYKHRMNDFRHKLQGWVACTMEIEAEPTRAQEIAMEETENALALLRVYFPSILHPSVVSHCRPVGRENIGRELIFSLAGSNSLSWSEHASADFRPLTFNREFLDMASNAGLWKLNELYMTDKKSEFQRELLSSVLTYSRSSLRIETTDRLIYVFTALDSFLLQNQSENIQQNIAERIAFTISSDAVERQKIKKNILSAYGMRSQAIHHNQGIKDKELVIQFLSYVFRFYILLIVSHDKHKTRQEFFDEVDLKKFS